LCLLWIALGSLPTLAQEGEAPPPDWVLTPAYKQRTTDPAAVARGKALYALNNCVFCHGADIRGGSGGVSLLRSQLVLRDKKGEAIFDVITKGVPNTAMTAFSLTPEQVADIAEYLHSFTVAGYDAARNTPTTIVTGNAAQGKRYFVRTCAGCHSVTGDLARFAARYPDARKLQQQWLMPKGLQKTTVAVTPSDGTAVSGDLVRIDEFTLTLMQADGTTRTFKRKGDRPNVVITDPLAPHKALLPKYRDADIHNLTAYLVTLK
jgi:cytochrome c oxidase cbb3-type subunit 3